MRDLIRRHAPPFIHAGLQSLRGLVNGPGTDQTNLRPLTFVADETGDRPRLNFAMPHLSARNAFGGIHTAIDLAIELTRRLNASRPCDLRFVVDALPGDEDNVLNHFRDRIGPLGAELMAPERGRLSTRKNDVFVTFNWWTNLNIMSITDGQAKHFGIARRPRVYLIQDFEPGFYAFSSAHLYALHAYNAPDGIYGIFNSSLLHDYYKASGCSVEKAFVFEPKIPERMRPFRDSLEAIAKEKLIVVYGRPEVERNCFGILMAGLRRFAQTHEHASHWRIVSVGTPHRRISLGNQCFVESLGKLAIEDYARLLQKAAIGVSLMASPHPSYPPLEMAHFGALTITNRYANKDLSGTHENITSLRDPMPGTLADALVQACNGFEQDPSLGKHGKPLLADYLSDQKFECLAELASAIAGLTG
jgi:hypothetical protein